GRGQGEEPQLRQGPRLRDLGAGAVTRSESFEDHFSEIAAPYAAHRPSYPAALDDFLARLAPETRLAWDAGCGSGQLSVLLAGPFDRVGATDASAAALAGLVGTWPAVWALEQAAGRGPFAACRRALAGVWGSAAVRSLRWPLAPRVGRVRTPPPFFFYRSRPALICRIESRLETSQD